MCYEKCANKTLVCGHTFCGDCVKTWYMRGGTCPMCRRKVHYRRMPVSRWHKEAEETKKSTIFQETFDTLLECVMEPIVFHVQGQPDDDEWLPNVNPNRYIPVKSPDGKTVTIHRRNVSLDEFADLEKTYRAIKDDCTPDELDYVLNDTDDYYSDRLVHLRNRTYSENGHKYPHIKRMDRVNRRNNARRS